MVPVPIWLAEMSGSIVLAILFGSVYINTRERFVGLWVLGWVVAIPGAVPLYSPGEQATLATGLCDLCGIVSSLILLRGNEVFHGKSHSRSWEYAAGAAACWAVLGSLLGLDFVAVTLSSSAFTLAAYVRSGPMFLRDREAGFLGRNAPGWGFLISGAHVMDFPFLSRIEPWGRWGYVVAFALGLVTVLGTLISFFEKRDRQSKRDAEAKAQAEQALAASEARYREMADLLPETVFEIDLKGDLTFGNRNGFDKFGYSQEDYERGLNVYDMIAPEHLERAQRNMVRVLRGEPRSGNEYVAVRKDGSTFPITIHATPIIKDGKAMGARGVIIDITDLKEAQEQLRYLSLHDPLTGLYNRTHFEQQVRRIQDLHRQPAGLLMCDMDGLKLVNDTLGHSMGDRLLVTAARIITGVFGRSDVIARVGGDEFAVLLLDLADDPKQALESASRRLQEAVEDYNRRHPELPLSISMGYAVSAGPLDLAQLFKEADDHMYREKLHRSQSVRNSIVQAMMKTLEARDYATEHHAERLEALVTGVAAALDFPSQRSADLKLLAQFHDIGKVGVSDRILFKPGPLNSREREDIRRHSEIGYRIAQTTPDLAPIADWILKHHEWWNGDGYPLGLKSEEIPLECRILAIADAYDAMTSERPYRTKLSKEEALAELQRCAGTQFDPEVVRVFVQQLSSVLETAASNSTLA